MARKSSIRDIRILSQNVNRSGPHTHELLETCGNEFDVLMIQEPSWGEIRRTRSTTDRSGDPVIGSQIHADWLTLVRPGRGADDAPRVLTYIHKRLAGLCPAWRSDLADHRDILVMSLTTAGPEPAILINVYSDSDSSGIRWLSDNAPNLPPARWMGGDFNCHSNIWGDPDVDGRNQFADRLVAAAFELGLSVSVGDRTPTRYPFIDGHRAMIIDLVFLPIGRAVDESHDVWPEARGPSDHAPLGSVIQISPTEVITSKLRVKPYSEEEDAYVQLATSGIVHAQWPATLDTPDSIEEAAEAIRDAWAHAWEEHATPTRTCKRSSPWWTNECRAARDRFRSERTKANLKAFRKECRKARRLFFNARIKNVAETQGRPWDLVNWTKQRELPSHEAIEYNGTPCHTLDAL